MSNIGVSGKPTKHHYGLLNVNANMKLMHYFFLNQIVLIKVTPKSDSKNKNKTKNNSKVAPSFVRI